MKNLKQSKIEQQRQSNPKRSLTARAELFVKERLDKKKKRSDDGLK